MNIHDLVNEVGFEPRRKASCHGGEFCSPCPFCNDGDDRFSIWPLRPDKDGECRGGRYSCRVCGKYGNAINFLRQIHGVGYLDACKQLKIETEHRNNKLTPRSKPNPPIVNEPSPLWSNKATLFIDWCHSELMKSPKAITHLTKRGFTLESIKCFKLGFNSGEETPQGYQKDFRRDRGEWGLPNKSKEGEELKPIWLPIGLAIPTFSEDRRVIKAKIRRVSYEKEMKVYEIAISKNEKPKWKPQKYIEISGSKACPAIFGDTSLPFALVLEAELDALLIQQEAADLVFCVALGGSTKQLDASTDELLRKKKKVLFLPDFDKAGKVAWDKWKKTFPNIKRILTPSEKSAGDYFQVGGDIREWLKNELTESLIII